jgi:DNA-directed DNA polymerase
MIYLVSKQQDLFKSDKYEKISPADAIEMLSKESILAADTETEGLDPYECRILSIQLGTEKYQIVWDCLSYPLSMLKDLLERPDILYLWHNYAFDSEFLLKESIVQKNFMDTMINERILNNGLNEYELALKACALKYCNYNMDKSARGEIIKLGLTERTIVYSGTDVVYLIPIYNAQLEELKKLDLVDTAKFESKFTIVTGYFKLCGVKLDVNKWKAKMKSDTSKMLSAIDKCNEWVLNYYKEHNGHNGYIEIDYLIDTMFIHPNDKNIPEDLNFQIPNGKVIKTKKVKHEKYGMLFYVTQEIPFGYWNKNHTEFTSYIEKVNAIQLDLFAEATEKFGDKCNIQWGSSQQIIPLFELLGFKLEVFNKRKGTTTKSVGEPVISKQLYKSPLAALYLEFKAAETVCNSYGEKFIKALSKDGRLRGDWRSIGTDTLRMSCKGYVHGQKINMQQLPSDAVTRACFVSEKGNSWISCDMSGQESRIMASLANDKNMIDLLQHGDIHSYVAKVTFKEIPRDCPIEDIKHKFHDLRQKAKYVEFAIAYGGDANTIMQRIGCTQEKAKEIYNAYMDAFPLVRDYQNYCRQALIDNGFILMNNVTKARCFIPDIERLKSIHYQTKTSEFWQEFKVNSELKIEYKWYKKTLDDYARKAINFRIQNRGSGCLKLSLLLFFKYIVEHNLLHKVLFVIGAHDEGNFEAPEDIAPELAKIYQDCVLKGSKPFCPHIDMESDVSYLKDGTLPNYWIH